MARDEYRYLRNVGPLSQKLKLAKANVLVAGTGGAARGAAFALADAGAHVSDHREKHGEGKRLARATGTLAVSMDDVASSHYDAIVHATPLGMHPHEDACFFEGEIPADIVFDMVYNPARTLLLQRAEEQGREIIPGSKCLWNKRPGNLRSLRESRRHGPRWRRPRWKR